MSDKAVSEQLLKGRWHHGHGVICCGTLRILRADFDTITELDKQNAALQAVCNALNNHYKLVEALETGIKWMQWWLDNNDCDCEDFHSCGRPARQRELESMRQALAEVKS